MINETENNAKMDSYRDSYWLKIEELRRMLYLYSDVLYHIRNNLLWEETDIDLTYWETALSSPQKAEEFDDDLQEIKEQMQNVIEHTFQICGYERDMRTGEYRKCCSELEE